MRETATNTVSSAPALCSVVVTKKCSPVGRPSR